MIAVLAVTSGSDPLLTRWYGWEWDDFGVACVDCMIYKTSFGSYFEVNLI
jgi:hypothetical protein